MSEVKPKLILISVVVSILVLVFLLVFAVNFKDHNISQSINDWGSFGDYFGSVLGAIFGFATFLMLLWSINMSATQFKDSRNHEETLLLYEMVKTIDSELEELFGQSDKIGKCDEQRVPTDFSLSWLNDRRVLVEDPEDGLTFPGGQLEDSEYIYSVEIPTKGKLWLETLTWFQYFMITNSSFFRLLVKFVELNGLLRRIASFSSKSPLISYYNNRYSTPCLVLTSKLYLKINEVDHLLTPSDKEVVESRLGFWDLGGPAVQPQEVDKVIDHLRSGIELS